MRILRQMSGVTREDIERRIRNEYVRGVVLVTGVASIVDMMRENRLRQVGGMCKARVNKRSKSSYENER